MLAQAELHSSAVELGSWRVKLDCARTAFASSSTAFASASARRFRSTGSGAIFRTHSSSFSFASPRRSSAIRTRSPHYVPFTDSKGDALCVDARSPGGPVMARVHDQGMLGVVLAPNLDAWLDQLAGAFDAGRFHIEHEGVWLDEPDGLALIYGRSVTTSVANARLPTRPRGHARTRRRHGRAASTRSACDSESRASRDLRPRGR